MKSRILAIVILLLLVGLPLLIYWLFFQKTTSNVIISFGDGIKAQIKLNGTFSNSFLPVADSVLNFSKDCEGFCKFGPIAPVKYNLEIISENFVTFTDTFELKNGETLEKKYELTPSVSYQVFNDFQKETSEQKNIFQNEIDEKFENLKYLGLDLKGRKWAIKTENSTTSLGFIKGDKFISLKNFSKNFSKIEFFSENNIFVFYDSSTKKGILLDTSLQNQIELDLPENIQNAFFENNWFIVSDGFTKEYDNSVWKENPRYSIYRDFGLKWRIAYIPLSDEKRLKLNNYNVSSGSVFVLINRQNGEIFEISRGLNIKNIFVVEDGFVFETDSYFYKINPEKIGL